MWIWVLVIVVGFFSFLAFTRWLGSRMYSETYDDRSSFIKGLKKLRDLCCGGGD